MMITQSSKQSIGMNLPFSRKEFSLTRPKTLEGEDLPYLDGYLIDKARSAVEFAAYTACPAIVVVLNSSGQLVRCPRDRLYSQSVDSPSGIDWSHI